MANRGSQFPGIPAGMPMMPQGQQQYVQPGNMGYPPRMQQYPGMMGYGQQGMPGQMMAGRMPMPGMARLPVNVQQRFVAPPPYTPQMAQNFQSSQSKQKQMSDDQRRELEKKRQFQMQQQKLKQVTKGGGRNLDATVLLESMFGNSDAQKPKQKAGPPPTQNDGFGDFLQAPDSNASCVPSGMSDGGVSAGMMDTSHGASQPEKLSTPSEAQPSQIQPAMPAKQESKKGLEDLMMQCSDLTAPQKAKGFHKPSVREVQPQQHKTASFKESQGARQWISTNTDELSNLFHLDAPLPQQPTKQAHAKASQHSHHTGHAPGKPRVFTLPKWCVVQSMIPDLYKHALEASMKDGKIDTSLVYPILIRSGLPKEALGHVWSLANKTTPGQLIKEELYMILALVALIQNNIPVHSLEILHQCPHAPVPNLGQHAPGAQVLHGVPPSGAVQPGVPQPGPIHPGAPQPGSIHPGAPQYGALQHSASHPGALNSVIPQSGLQQPVMPQSGSLQPVMPQSGSLQPGVPQPGPMQPAPQFMEHSTTANSSSVPNLQQMEQVQPVATQFGSSNVGTSEKFSKFGAGKSSIPPLDAFPDKHSSRSDVHDDDFDDFKCASPFTDSSSSCSSSVRTDSNAESSSSDTSSCSSDLSKGISTSRVMVFELSKKETSSPYNFFSAGKDNGGQKQEAEEEFGGFSSAPNSHVLSGVEEFADFKQADNTNIAEAARQETFAAFGKQANFSSSSHEKFSAIKSLESSSNALPKDDDWADFSSAPAMPTAAANTAVTKEETSSTLMSLDEDKYGALRDFEVAPETQPTSVFGKKSDVSVDSEGVGNTATEVEDFGDFMASGQSESATTGVDLFSLSTGSSNISSPAAISTEKPLDLFSSVIKDKTTGPSLGMFSQSKDIVDDEFADFASVPPNDQFADFTSATTTQNRGFADFSTATPTNTDKFGDFSMASTNMNEGFSDSSSNFGAFPSSVTSSNEFTDFSGKNSFPKSTISGVASNTFTMFNSAPPEPDDDDDFADFASPVKPKPPSHQTSNISDNWVADSWGTEPPPLDMDEEDDDMRHSPLRSSFSVDSHRSLDGKPDNNPPGPKMSDSDFSLKPQPPPLSSPGHADEDFDFRPSPPPFPDDSPKTPTDSFFPSDHHRPRRDFFGHQPSVKPVLGTKKSDSSSLDFTAAIVTKNEGDITNLASASSDSVFTTQLPSLRGVTDSQSANSLEMFPGWKSHSNADSQSVSSLELPSLKNQSKAGSAVGDNQSTSSSEFGGLEMAKSASNSDVKSLDSLDLKPSQNEDEVNGMAEDSFGEFSSAEPCQQGIDNVKPKDEWSSHPRSASELLDESGPPIVGDRYSKIMHDVQDSDKHLHEWQRCLEGAYELIKNANNTFNEISTSSVCREIINCEQGSEYLTGIVEVYRVVCRIMASKKIIGISCPKLDNLLKELDLAWNNLVAFIAGSTVMPDQSLFDFSHCGLKSDDTSSQKSACGVCLLNVDIKKASSNKNTDNRKLSYGGRQYHASCSNFWVNCVDSMLPALKPPELL